MNLKAANQASPRASRIERAAYRFEESRLLQSLFTGLNLLPLPYRWMPLRVKGQRMYAHTFDRYFALWMWKLRSLEGFGERRGRVRPFGEARRQGRGERPYRVQQGSRGPLTAKVQRRAQAGIARPRRRRRRRFQERVHFRVQARAHGL